MNYFQTQKLLLSYLMLVLKMTLQLQFYTYNNGQNIFTKTICHTMNVTSTEAKLFLIRCRINQAVQVPNTKYIIVITDIILATRYILDLSTYPFQLHSIAVFQDLRAFFNKSSINSIMFQDCPSSDQQPSYSVADKETKQLKINPIFPCKSLQEFDKKEECDSLLKKLENNFSNIRL